MSFDSTAKFLREAREAANMSQADLAEKLGLHAQSISNIERGLTSIPRKYVFTICSILKVEPRELVDIMLEDVRRKYL